MTITGIHPYANRFPMLPNDELEELVASIAANGLRNPVVITPEGLILDGRNRAKACDVLEMDPETVVYEGDDLAEYVIDCNTTRRHLTTGQRAMASALVLADDGRREGGRWRRGSVRNDESVITGWAQRLKECGVVLDYSPDLAFEVVAGTLTLNAAFQSADETRRCADAAQLAKKAAEKKAREEAKAKAEREAKIIADLAELGSRYSELIESGTLTPAAAWAAYLSDTEKERRDLREREDGIRRALQHIQESVRYLSGGRQAAAVFIADALHDQGRLSPEGMHLTAQNVTEAIEYLTAIQEEL